MAILPCSPVSPAINSNPLTITNQLGAAAVTSDVGHFYPFVQQIAMPKGDRLAAFEVYVMLAIAHIGDNAYGVTIRQEIETRMGRSVAIGAVYATLGRLYEKGFVAFAISDPDPVRGGRSRKLASLTRAGRRALADSVASFTRMVQGFALQPIGGGKR